jgi:hypothetical protein
MKRAGFRFRAGGSGGAAGPAGPPSTGEAPLGGGPFGGGPGGRPSDTGYLVLGHCDHPITAITAWNSLLACCIVTEMPALDGDFATDDGACAAPRRDVTLRAIDRAVWLPGSRKVGGGYAGSGTGWGGGGPT